jgi:hypothetical protein
MHSTITWIFLIFSFQATYCQDVLTYSSGNIYSENKPVKNSELKGKVSEIGSAEVKNAFRRYRRFKTFKGAILATETAFVLGATDYDTGVPRLNIATLSVGLSAATLDILLRKPLRKRARRFVEEYNFNVSEQKLITQ